MQVYYIHWAGGLTAANRTRIQAENRAAFCPGTIPPRKSSHHVRVNGKTGGWSIRRLDLALALYSLLDRMSESPGSITDTTEQLKSFPHAVPSSVLSPA